MVVLNKSQKIGIIDQKLFCGLQERHLVTQSIRSPFAALMDSLMNGLMIDRSANFCRHVSQAGQRGKCGLFSAQRTKSGRPNFQAAMGVRVQLFPWVPVSSLTTVQVEVLTYVFLQYSLHSLRWLN